MSINRWWDADPSEVYWLETTERDDIGVDLHTPQFDDRGVEHHSYSQILEIQPGDIVFHYDKNESAIMGWSRASGEVFDTQIFWGSHAASTRQRGRGAYLRPGWSLALDGPHFLSDALSLEMIRARVSQIHAVRSRIKQSTGGSVYFPFELSDLRPPRPTQFYLTKFPAELVGIFPQLSEARAPGLVKPPRTPRQRGLGRPRQPNVELRQKVEREAQRAVENMYSAQGYQVEDVSHLNLGWDVEASKIDERLRVEVKGRSSWVISAELTPNEFRRMRERDPLFRLCIVTETLDPERRSIYEFKFDPRRNAWVSADCGELYVDVIQAARVGADREI